MQTQPVESVFGRAWDLLTKNWIIIVPGLVIGIVVGAIQDLYSPPVTYSINDPTTVTSTVGHGIASLVVGLIALFGFVLNTAYTTGMAGAAWLRGRTTFADGWVAFQRDGGNIVAAMIGLFILGIVAVVLSVLLFFLLGLPLLAYLFLFIYTMPAAVVGERGGFSSLGESYRIATKRFAPTFIVVLVIAVLALVAGLIAGLFSFAPFLGPIVAQLLTETVVAYFTLVLVGEYLNLRGTVEPAAPIPPV